jgi:hypothetical protein
MTNAPNRFIAFTTVLTDLSPSILDDQLGNFLGWSASLSGSDLKCSVFTVGRLL